SSLGIELRPFFPPCRPSKPRFPREQIGPAPPRCQALELSEKLGWFPGILPRHADNFLVLVKRSNEIDRVATAQLMTLARRDEVWLAHAANDVTRAPSQLPACRDLGPSTASLFLEAEHILDDARLLGDQR